MRGFDPFGRSASTAWAPSQELFSTMLSTTAQGITFGNARLLLGVWSFLVPVLAATDIEPVALMLTISLAISGVVGFLSMLNTAGESPEKFDPERGRYGASERVTT